jgi:hypothetical protein
VELITRLRKELAGQGLYAGPQTIAWHLKHDHQAKVSPAAVSRRLARQALVTPDPSKRPKSSCIRFAAEQPNERRQSDFTHYPLAGGQDTEIPTWPAGRSRYALSLTAHHRADVQRRRFLVNAVFTSAALPASALRWLTSPPAAAPSASGTRKVGRADIDAIRELTRTYRDMDNRLGGGKLRTSVVSYLDDHVSRLLTAGSYREQTGRQLAAACGELSQLAGWVAYDSDEHGLAQRYLTQALAYARHADDHALAAEILAAQAHQALYLARPDEAVDLARAAQAAAVRYGSATLLTECLVMEAHGHAARNDASACGVVLARAEQTFDRAAREDDPAWLSYFDEAYLAARMAQCFRDLGESGHAARYARRSRTWTAATSAAGPSTSPCSRPPTRPKASPCKRRPSDGKRWT